MPLNLYMSYNEVIFEGRKIMKITAELAVRVGFKLWAGVSTGYFVYKITEEKARELAQKGNILNAFTIGAGQMGLSLIAGQLAFWTIA